MKCPKCGSDVDDEANFCSKCGFKLKVDTETLKIKINELRHKTYEGLISMVSGIGLAIFGILVAVGTGFWRIAIYVATIILVLGLALIIFGGIYSSYYSHKKDELLKLLERENS